MDRLMVYPGAIPLDTDVLSVERNVMTSLGWLMQAALGTGTGVVGLACNPTVPASMTVNIGPGALWAQAVIDQSNFGSLSADASPLMKMGILPEAAGTNFTLTAPAASGQSINYLIEAAFEESDSNPVVLPYVNPANPAQPFTGPDNSGTPQNTVRAQTIALQLKAGVAANTGTQTTPTVDAGYIGLYVITVNFGQTTITGADITQYENAPFLGGPFAQLEGNPAQSFMGAPAAQRNQFLTLGQFLANSGKNIVVFTPYGAFLNGVAIPGWSNGESWSPPSNITGLWFCTGGGGGGAASQGSGSSYPSGGGGGAGGTAIAILNLLQTDAPIITVGNGGGGGNYNDLGSGAGGETSSIGNLISATGGAGAVWNRVSGSAGGQGGAAVGGNLNLYGGWGSDGVGLEINATTTAGALGNGGASFWGGGTRAGDGGGGENAAFGAGGGGAYGDPLANGAPGGAGTIVGIF